MTGAGWGGDDLLLDEDGQPITDLAPGGKHNQIMYRVI